MAETADDLIARGRIEAVVPDDAAARAELEQAQANIASAEGELPETNPGLAYTAIYDATRLAISAHMRASGYRVTGGPGAHVKFGEYAAAALAGRAIRGHLARFNRMRQTRNRLEYGAGTVGAAAVRADLEHARAVVDTITAELEREPQ
jgi:hypothetical protein